MIQTATFVAEDTDSLDDIIYGYIKDITDDYKSLKIIDIKFSPIVYPNAELNFSAMIIYEAD
jgi:hypothetical protein